MNTFITMNTLIIDSLCYKGSRLNNELRERAVIAAVVCRILNENKPVTVKEIVKRLSDEELAVSLYSVGLGKEYGYKIGSWRKDSHAITHVMQRLVKTGAVKAEKKDFGEITLDDGKTVRDIRNVYSLNR